jgi:hypothetical protein
MTLFVLAAICFLACSFYVYVLIHWSQETKRLTTTRSAAESQADENGERRRPHVVGSRAATRGGGRFAPRSLWPAAWQSGRAGAGLVVMSANGMCTK